MDGDCYPPSYSPSAPFLPFKPFTSVSSLEMLRWMVHGVTSIAVGTKGSKMRLNLVAKTARGAESPPFEVNHLTSRFNSGQTEPKSCCQPFRIPIAESWFSHRKPYMSPTSTSRSDTPRSFRNATRGQDHEIVSQS
ncbi:hypothetical protein Vi05172_g7771 [Venturia inaequalis]|nr:hypothetical protein Vi05172_g7771 [Venturia inaequalis]